MNFGPNNLNDICAITTAVLSQEFPGQNFVVLPDTQVEKGQVGLFIATRFGEDRVVMSHPMVNILDPFELGTPKMLQELAAAIEKELDALKNPPPPETAAPVETPLLASAKRKKKD